MGTSQSQDYGPTPKFLLVNGKEMIDFILEKEKRRMDALKIVKESTALLAVGIKDIECTITTFGTLLGIIDAKASFYERYTERMIDRSLTNFAINDLKAEIKTISNGVGRVKNFDHSNSDFSKQEIMILFNSCDKILIKFEDHDHIFYQHPLITTPYLIAFSQLYLSIIEISIILISTYKDYRDFSQDKQRLRNVIEKYKMNTINDRIELIKVKETFKRVGPDLQMIGNAFTAYLNDSSRDVSKSLKHITNSELIRDVDMVQDALWDEEKPKKVYNWDRAIWDKHQGTRNNYEYTDVVRIVYEKFFNDIINLIK